jgi:hypothetical protein
MKRSLTKKTLRELQFLSLSGMKIGLVLIPPLLQRESRTLWTQFQREPLLTLQREVPPPDQGVATIKPNTMSTWLVAIDGKSSGPTLCRPLLSKD